MTKQDLKNAIDAIAIMRGVATGATPIIRVYTDLDSIPTADDGGWTVEVMTSNKDLLTFSLEGLVISKVVQVQSASGHLLRGEPAYAADWLGAQAQDLEAVVIHAIAQSVPR